MTPDERLERAERRLRYAEQKISALEGQVAGLLRELEVERVVHEHDLAKAKRVEVPK